MKFFLNTLLVILAMSLFAGCGNLAKKVNIHDRSDNYKKARVQAPIVFVDDLNTQHVQSLYEIPGELQEVIISEPDDAGNISVSPVLDYQAPAIEAPIAGAGYEKNLKIQSLGKTYWLLAQFRPSTLWSALQDFIGTQTFKAQQQDAIAGVLETNWLARVDKPGVYEKFQFRVNVGVQQGTAELHVTEVMRDAASRDQAVDWSAGSSVKSRELEMLKRAATYLESRRFEAVSNPGAEHRALQIKKYQDTVYLNVGLNYTRAWASAAQAIKKADYILRDMDSSQGQFLVATNIEGNAAQPGFFKRLIGAKPSYEGDLYLQLKPVSENQTGIFVKGIDGQPSKEQVEKVLRGFMAYLD